MLELVDPELRQAAEQSRALYAQFTPMSLDRLAARREWLSSMQQPVRSDVPIDEGRVPLGNGLDDFVTVFVVNASPGASRPGIVHTHGGGLTGSSARASLPSLQALSLELGCTIVSIEYGLAPETTYERSMAENYAALVWVQRRAEELGIDLARLGLLGESGGGAHAALLAITARDRGEVSLACQVLVYPMLDDRTGGSRPLPDHIGYFGWNADANQFGWRCFLGTPPGGDEVPAGAVPARVADLKGLPPTFLGVGALDVLVNDSIEFAARLIDAGVATELVVVPGAFHGFDSNAPQSAVARRFTAAKLGALRRGLGLSERVDA